MNRYLFKAKRLDNGDWVKGNIIREWNKNSFGLMQDFYFIYISKSAETGEHKKNMVDPQTICQCSGLKDKNGNLIFEGDVLEILDYAVDYDNPIKYIARVVFGNPHTETHWGWNLIFKNNANCLTDILCWIEMEESQVYSEIIGNIHDNKEILEEEK